MTQEEKQLLLQDLCNRLLYGVIIQVKEWTTFDTELKIGHIQRLQNDDIEIKPYLRSMDSMTKEEMEELKQVALVDNEGVPGDIPAYIDWLNKKMFDYRGLIPMGLALEAPEGMYKTK